MIEPDIGITSFVRKKGRFEIGAFNQARMKQAGKFRNGNLAVSKIKNIGKLFQIVVLTGQKNYSRNCT